MLRVVRNHFIVFSLSILFSFILYGFCYADEIETVESEDLSSDEFVSDQSLSLSDSTNQSVTNFYVENLILPEKSESEVEEEEEEIYILSPAESRAQSSLPSIPRDNTILYSGSFSGRSCWVLFSQSDTDSLITVNGSLINVGTSIVTGRVFYTDEFDFSDYELSFLVLPSQFSTGLANTLYQYSYPSYVRYYYFNGTRLTNSDSYGLFTVYEVLDTTDHSRSFAMYQLLIVVVLFIGSGFIFSRLGRN